MKQEPYRDIEIAGCLAPVENGLSVSRYGLLHSTASPQEEAAPFSGTVFERAKRQLRSMKWFFGITAFLVVAWIGAVQYVNRNGEEGRLQATDSLQAKDLLIDSVEKDSTKVGGGMDSMKKNPLPLPEGVVDTRNVQPQQVVGYAQTLTGTPYLYGSTDPAKGFDCSGFITHVFNHFAIAVPRSSIDFTNVGKEVSATEAKGGDLILFTGTDRTERFVGHMGIVVSNTDTLRFIHSSSGKANGVTVTPLNPYYGGRYVKTIRVFP